MVRKIRAKLILQLRSEGLSGRTIADGVRFSIGGEAIDRRLESRDRIKKVPEITPRFPLG